MFKISHSYGLLTTLSAFNLSNCPRDHFHASRGDKMEREGGILYYLMELDGPRLKTHCVNLSKVLNLSNLILINLNLNFCEMGIKF